MTAPAVPIDHEYTPDLVCPYCGYVNRDSWEIGHDEGETNCNRCEKLYEYERHITVRFSTAKVKP